MFRHSCLKTLRDTVFFLSLSVSMNRAPDMGITLHPSSADSKVRPASLFAATLRILIACVLLSAIDSCSDRPAPRSDTLEIVASISPLADFVRHVAGGRATVHTLLPSNANPHTFELTPQQLETAARADALVMNGAGLEYWLPKLQGVLSSDRPRICTASNGLELLRDGHGNEANPHLWLDPVSAVRMVENIRDALVTADSVHAGEYRANAARYIDSLRALDTEIRTAISSWSRRAFIAYHASWAYFARRYNLAQVAAIESSPGREITPKEYGAIIAMMRRDRVLVVVGETSSPLKPAETLAAETGATLAVLDPIGTTTASYLEMMRGNLAALARAMR
jgi:ABC-type Zn uptake system ZnuABC Zn-binding protein ZnuA